MTAGRSKSHTVLTFCLALLLALTPLSPGLLSTALAIAPTLSSGDNSSYIYGQKNLLTFVVKNAPVNESPVIAITPLDGQAAVTIGTGDYTLKNTTTAHTLTFTAAFLKTLSYSHYTLTLSYSSGGVTADFYIFPTANMLFLEQPATVVTNKGDDATFTVRVTGSSSGKYTYQWQRKSRTGWKNIKRATTRTLTLKNVQDYLTGYTFRCLVHGADGDAYSAEAKLYIIGAGDESKPWLYAIGTLVSLMGMVGCVLYSCRKKSDLSQK